MKIVIASKNADKLREIRALFGKERGVEVLSLSDFPSCREVAENKTTFAGNAEKKAREYSRHTQSLTLADDSGLMVHFLNGRPGVYSARFAGENCTYADNNKRLLRLLKNVPPSKRGGTFVSVVSIYDNGRCVKTVRGECAGTIALEERGKKGFGYDPIFIPKGFKKTYAEMTPAEKNKISHRGRALQKARQAVLKYLKKKN